MKSENHISYGSVTVKLYERENGATAVKWRENGKRHSTTITSKAKAREFAKRKAKELDRASGAQWVTPARQDRLGMLERIAGGEMEAGRLLGQVEKAVEILGDANLLEAAAAYYKKHGPMGVVRNATMREVADLLLEEYKHSPNPTRASMRNQWEGFVKGRENVLLLDVTRDDLLEYFDGKKWSVRTRRNAITRWATFFNRAKELELWPADRPLPTDAIKRGKEEDKAPEIFSVREGGLLISTVAQECVRYVTYLLLTGWLGVRPSEALRLQWKHFDAEHKLLHLPSSIVGKTARERWVPVHPLVCELLIFFREGKENHEQICLTKAREEVSKLARKKLKMHWPKDVLRHCYITYRLQITNNDIYTVAEEAGNSPSVIRSNYRRPIPPGQGEKWFQQLANISSIISAGP